MSSEQEPTGKPGRYERSPAALIGSLIVIVALMGVFVLVRAFFSTETEFEPDDVDYVAAVRSLQASDVEVVYPASVPEGWQARNFDVEPGDPPTAIGFSFLTEDGRFIGFRQEVVTRPEELVETYVDENATLGDVTAIPESVVREWDTWSDEGGDTGFSAEYGDYTLLAFGSASADEIRAFVESLVDEPLTPPSPEPTPDRETR